jgi:hypothetical protein
MVKKAKEDSNATGQSVASKAKTIEEILNSHPKESMPGYLNLVNSLKQFYRSKDSDKLDVNTLGKSIYNSLETVLREDMKDVYSSLDTKAMLQSIKYNIDGNSLKKEGLNMLATYSKDIVSKLWDEMKSNLTSPDSNTSQLNSLLAAILLGGKEFGDLYDQLSSHDSFKLPKAYGSLISEIKGEMGDTSNVGTYFGKLLAARAGTPYKNSNFTPEQIKKIEDESNSLYKEMVAEMDEIHKQALQKNIYNMLSGEMVNNISKVDLDHARSKLSGADPVEGLSAVFNMPQYFQGPGD